MSVIYILLPVATALAATAVAAFVWAVRRGQFDDLDTPAVRILYDDEDQEPRSLLTTNTRSPQRGQDERREHPGPSDGTT